jgi:hypothetical protein
MVQCLRRVRRAKSVILLQTADVLSYPWVLLAVYCACFDRIPLLCVLVEDAGYDFGQGRAYLEHLEQNLGDVTRARLTDMLTKMEIPADLSNLQQVLLATVPNIISVVYSSDGTTNELIATVHDIRDKQTLLQSRIKRQPTRRLSLSKSIEGSTMRSTTSRGSVDETIITPSKVRQKGNRRSVFRDTDRQTTRQTTRRQTTRPPDGATTAAATTNEAPSTQASPGLRTAAAAEVATSNVSVPGNPLSRQPSGPLPREQWRALPPGRPLSRDPSGPLPRQQWRAPPPGKPPKID